MIRVRQKTDGFTLIEILVTVSLVVVLASLVSIQFSRYMSNLTLRDAANDFYQFALMAQEKAVIDRRSVKMEIDYYGRSYRLTEEAEDRWGETSFLPVAGRLSKAERFSEEIAVSGPRAEIRCFPDGVCRAGTWRLAHSGGAAVDIIVSEVPSRISLRQVPR